MKQSSRAARTNAADAAWKKLYVVGGAAALGSVALIPIQVAIFLAWPPPEAIADWFALFQRNGLLGLLSFDLLYLLNNTFLILMYLALYLSLRRLDESLMAIALTLGLVGVAAYFVSNRAFEMLALSQQHAAATTEAQRAVFLAAGQAMLAVYKGTAFDVYYVFNAAALLIIAVVMLRSRAFGRAAAWAGLLAGVLMVVPSTVTTIGTYFALASLVPWMVFSILVARGLFRLARLVLRPATA
jgi:hypothetical protein